MYIKNLIDEDFVNYKKVSMFIGCYSCSFKCDKLAGKQVCQNSALAHSPNIQITIDDLVERYLNNPLSNAIVFGGLEPLDDLCNIMVFIELIRSRGNMDDIVIYTGYTKEEVLELFPVALSDMKKYPNIIIKYGRFIPDQSPHFDSILGVNLQSDNQFAERIS